MEELWRENQELKEQLKNNQMNTDNLISLVQFAERAKLRQDEVTRLITPQKIQTVEIGGRKFIDSSIYNPEDYTKSK